MPDPDAVRGAGSGGRGRDARSFGYRSADVRARWTSALIALTGGIAAAAAALQAYGLAVVLPRAEQGLVEYRDLVRFDETLTTLYLGVIAANIAAAVAWLAWLSRSIDNVPTLGVGAPSVSPRAAIGWWFVPFANLVKPYQIVADLYRRVVRRPPAVATALLLGWWFAFLLPRFIGRLAETAFDAADDIRELRDALLLSISGDLLTVISAVLAIRLVLDVQRGEDTLAAVEIPPPGELSPSHPL